jgi:pimeloyl-ACP methyl ester carboxylesterase
MTLVVLLTLASFPLPAQTRGKERAVGNPTFYRTTQVDGLSIFYREAGPKDAPALLLLHGLPSSSRMFEPLFARLSDRYHLVAPDYPGFGHSDWPDPAKFAYTFDHYAEILNRFTEALGLSRYTLYMQDYGGPVGFRMTLAHPERVEALIVQDAVAHNEGLGANWKARRAFWTDRAANENSLRANLLSQPTTRTRHVGSDPNVERYDPDLWTDEFAFLNQPGQAQIQSDLFYDYRTNVDAYPRWQAWMREKQPRLLVLWGKYDPLFRAFGAGGLSPRRAEGGSPRPRGGSFRARYRSGSDCGARPRLPEPRTRNGETSWQTTSSMTAGASWALRPWRLPLPSSA